MSVKIFFCYAHEDEALLNKLKAQLRPLQRQGLLDVWYDRDISAGTDWEQQIKEQLNTAQIILLLVSPDFMDSDYINDVELKRAIERHERGEAHVIPVILRHVYWQGEPLGKLQALPTDGKPVIDRSWHSLDEAFLNVAQGIQKAIIKLEASVSAPTLMSDFASSYFVPPTSSLHQSTINLNDMEDSVVQLQSYDKSQREEEEEEGRQNLLNFNRVILGIAFIGFILLCFGFFFGAMSIVSQIGTLVAVIAFILALIQTGLLKQWYWFISILILSPLIGFEYYFFDPATSTTKWFWFICILSLSSVMIILFGLLGPTEPPHHLISHIILKQLILIISAIGLILFIFALIDTNLLAGTDPVRLAIYVGVGFMFAGYVLTLIQLIRLKQSDWLEGVLTASIIFFPTIALIGIIYGINGPVSISKSTL